METSELHVLTVKHVKPVRNNSGRIHGNSGTYARSFSCSLFPIKCEWIIRLLSVDENARSRCTALLGRLYLIIAIAGRYVSYVETQESCRICAWHQDNCFPHSRALWAWKLLSVCQMQVCNAPFFSEYQWILKKVWQNYKAGE